MTMATAVETQGLTETPGQVIERFQQDAPVDIVGIANTLGVNVWEDVLLDGVSGKIFRDPLNGGSSGFSIVVSKTESLFRKRFTVAHEIAHFILHRDALEGGLIEDALFRSGLSSKIETEANKLAAEILMPFGLIQKLIAADVRSIEDLSEALEVSKAAISIRLGVSYSD